MEFSALLKRSKCVVVVVAAAATMVLVMAESVSNGSDAYSRAVTPVSLLYFTSLFQETKL